MRLICIINNAKITQNSCFSLLKQSAEQRNVELVIIDPAEQSLSDLEKFQINKNDALYRISTDKRATMAEFLLNRDNIITLRHEFEPLDYWSDLLKMSRAGVPIIPTKFGIDSSNEILEKDIADLGGFPVIIKLPCESHGAGVLKVDSIDSLRSVASFVMKKSNQLPVLKKFIDNARHIRCVVLGDRVVNSIEYLKKDEDFRTNTTSEPNVVPFMEDDRETFDIAVRACKARHHDFGGVDVLISEDGKKYVAETNLPCNFARNQNLTGVDISGMLIDYFLSKSSI
jgi:glutathione synthase/RimK-type ligase-like ATP-grasp enzyme